MTRRHTYRYSGLGLSSDFNGQISDTWSDLSPTVAVAIGGQYDTYDQTGSRICYINYVSGHDGTATSGVPARGTQWSHLGTDTTIPDVYFWNGTNIIDSQGRTAPAEGAHSGLAYGTDPLQPSASVKPFKTYCYCGHKAVGATSEQIGNLDNIPTWRTLSTCPRGGKDDWFLFARDVTHQIGDDFRDWQFLRDGTTTIATDKCMSAGGTGVGYCVYDSYGDPTLDRAHLVKPAGHFFGFHPSGSDFIPKNVYIRSLHLNGNDRTYVSLPWGVHCSGGSTTTGSWTFEDCWFDQVAQNEAQTNNAVTFFRCIITDANSNGGGTAGQGLFYADYTGLNLGGTPNVSRLNIKECIWGRNGFATNPNTTWPPTSYNTLTRNVYLTGAIDQANSYIKDNIFLYGASSDQIRCGGNVTGNFIYAGGFLVSGHGHDNGGSPVAYIADNVLLGFKGDTGIPNFSGHATSAFSLTFGVNNSTFERNLYSLAQLGYSTVMNGSCAILLTNQHGTVSDEIDHTCSGNIIQNNIFDCGTSTSGVRTATGYRSAFHRGPWPGVSDDNIVRNNIFIKPAGTLLVQEYYANAWTADQESLKTERSNAATTYTVSTTLDDAIVGPAIVGSPVFQTWELVVTSVGPVVFSVTGLSKGNPAARPALGAMAPMTLGTAYANAYWSCTNSVDEGQAFAVGDILRFHINEQNLASIVTSGNVERTDVSSFSAPNRTIVTYLQLLGETVTSSDGYTEYLALLKTVRKGNWPKKWTATAINNHLLGGRDMATLAYP